MPKGYGRILRERYTVYLKVLCKHLAESSEERSMNISVSRLYLAF
jgi:hypothetical protein